MTAFQKQVLWKVMAVHGMAILVVLLLPILKGCKMPDEPKELIFVEIVSAGPPVEVDYETSIPDRPSQQQEAPPAEPTPELSSVVEPPTSIPDPIPTPPKEPPQEKKKTVEPPKQRLSKPEDIVIGPKVKSTAPSPVKVDTSSFKSELSDWVKTPATAATGSPSELAKYDATLLRIFKGAWERPGVGGGRPAKVKVSFRKNGSITGRVLVDSSGDATFDASVMEAVRAVNVLPRPPDGYPAYSIIRFSLVD